MNVKHRGALGDILYSWFWLYQNAIPVHFYVPEIGGFSPYHNTMNQYLSMKDLANEQPYLASFNLMQDGLECDDLRWYVDGGASTDAPTIIKPYFVGHKCEWPAYEPWIFGVDRPQTDEEYSVINITPRYRDHRHQWNKYLPAGTFKFIGLKQEYDEFRHYLLNSGYGDAEARMVYAPTANLLEAAQVIAGAKAFFGNASSCLALAQGLGIEELYVEVSQGTHKTCLFGHEKILNEGSING